MIHVEGQARCHCERPFTVNVSAFPCEHACACGSISIIHRCTACGDIEIIYESARRKRVTCGNCGNLIQKGGETSTKMNLGTAVETVYVLPVTIASASSREVRYTHPAGPPSAERRDTHRRIIANSVSGPRYSGDKTATCWGGNRCNGKLRGPRR